MRKLSMDLVDMQIHQARLNANANVFDAEGTSDSPIPATITEEDDEAS